MDWIIHLDTDELLHPAGTREYSLRELFSNVPEKFDMVVFPNYVSEPIPWAYNVFLSLHLNFYSRIDYEFMAYFI